MAELPRRITNINMSAIPVNGVGGWGMLAIAVVIAIEFPEAHWLLAISAIGGLCLGAALIFWRRGHEAKGPSGGHPDVLFVNGAAPASARRDPDRGQIEQLAAAH